MIIDTHVHYNLPPLFKNWRRHWHKAQTKGVTHAIIIGTNLKTSQLALEIAVQEKNLFGSIGVHPHDIEQLNIQTLKELETMAQKSKIVAIGEIGLDYFKLKNNNQETKERQKAGFIKQINLANKLNLPIIIHIRDAYDDALKIIKKYPPKNNFVLHCFSGTTEYAKKMIEFGAYFGVDGNITYQNATHLRDLLYLLPKDKIVVETDSPYLPPMPYRGKLCKPWMIKLTTNYLTDNFSIPREQLVINSQTIFPMLVPYQPEFETYFLSK